jgi:pimeloyl-ACP methyl ester carboxylesterase
LEEGVEFVRKRHLKNRVYMFGWSLGVLYTLWYSANHPDSLDGIILAEPYWVGSMPLIYRIKIPSMLVSAPETIYDT